MNSLQQSTQRRLKNLPQTNSVWEGDRRVIQDIDPDLSAEMENNGECIIWIDGSEGVVRAMEMVSSELGPEAVVRTLLRAIENPHSPAEPSRPQKIVVRDREIQFFLRGALQNLDINIDYAPKLPLIDELFRTLTNTSKKKPPQLPPEYAEILEELALEIWDDGFWDLLADHDVIAIEFADQEMTPVYACILGMSGQEYGIILYRSLDSLKRFREKVLMEKSMEKLENAFLSQDCWFINFESKGFEPEYEDEDFDLAELSSEEIHPIFGSLHPYEGMRVFLDEDEALTVYLSLAGLKQFFWQYLDELQEGSLEKLSNTYKVKLPYTKEKSKNIKVKVSNLPELSSELLAMIEEMEEDEDEDDYEDEDSKFRIAIKDDLVPENSFINFQFLPWEMIDTYQTNSKIYYHSQEILRQGEGLPVIIIQTSRPKAEFMIEKLKAQQGIKGFCFHPGENPFTGEQYDLGIIQTHQGDLYILSEFMKNEEDLDEWKELCLENNNNLAVIIAMGVTGVSKGNPQTKHILALFEATALSTNELGMGVLQLMPQFDFEME